MSDNQTILEQIASAQAGQELTAEVDDDGSISVFYYTVGDERGLTSWNFFKSGTVVCSNTKLGVGMNLRPPKPQNPNNLPNIKE